MIQLLQIIRDADPKLSPKNDDETKTTPTNFNEKNVTCKTQNFYFLLAFLLITIALLIAVSIYCYPIKYRAKQKHLIEVLKVLDLIKNM